MSYTFKAWILRNNGRALTWKTVRTRNIKSESQNIKIIFDEKKIQLNTWLTTPLQRVTTGFVLYARTVTFSLVNTTKWWNSYVIQGTEETPSWYQFHSCLNLRSGVPIFFIRGGKVRLIHLLDYLSVASAESGLFSDWSRNKRSVSLACYWQIGSKSSHSHSH